MPKPKQGIVRDCVWCDERISLPTDKRKMGRVLYCSAGCQVMAKAARVGDCWKWPVVNKRTGYGQIAVRLLGHGKKMMRAHLVSYRCFVGDIPRGQFVCHSCDVRDCVNPRHLFLGTPRENTQDAVTKGRMSRGEQRYNAKLNANDAIAIFNDKTTMQKELAARYGVCRGTIQLIKAKKIWKHVLEQVAA